MKRPVLQPIRCLIRVQMPLRAPKPVNNAVNFAISPSRFYVSGEPPGTINHPSARPMEGKQIEDAPTQPGEPPINMKRESPYSTQRSGKDRQAIQKNGKLSRAIDSEERPGLMPRTLEALYLQPLRRVAQYGVPTCDLQLRSYSARNLEFFCDFALRAAYYAGLPSFGPVPLPRLKERWTVPKGHFIDKKSQENFERITLRRLIQIRDGHPETVQVWLAFLQKHQYYGVGMKANVWEFSSADVGKEMDKRVEEVSKELDKLWGHMAVHPKFTREHNVEEFLATERLKAAGGR